MTDAQTNSDGQSSVEAFIEGLGAKAKKITETRVAETLAAAGEARTALADFGSSLVDQHFGDATGDQVLTSATKAIEGITNTVVTGLGGQDLTHAVAGLEDSGRALGGKLIDYHFGEASSDQVFDAAGKVGADISNTIFTGLVGRDAAEAIANARDSGSDLTKTGIDYHFGEASGDQVLDAFGKTGGAVSNAVVTGLGGKDLASAVAEARDSVSDVAKTAIDYQFGEASGGQILDAVGKASGQVSNAIVTGVAGKDVAAAVANARDSTSDLVGKEIDHHFGGATDNEVLDAIGKTGGDISNAIVTGLAGKDVADTVTRARDSTSDLVWKEIDRQFGDATDNEVLDAVGKTGGDISNAIVTGLAGKDVAAALTTARDSTSDLAGTVIDYHFGDATSDQVLGAAGKAGGEVSNAIVTGLADNEVAAAVAKARDSTADLAKTGIDYEFGEATGDQVLDAAGKTAGTISDAIVTDLAGSGTAEAVRSGREAVSDLVGDVIDGATDTTEQDDAPEITGALTDQGDAQAADGYVQDLTAQADTLRSPPYADDTEGDGPTAPANDNVETDRDSPDFPAASDADEQRLTGDSDDESPSTSVLDDGARDSFATGALSYNDAVAPDTTDVSTATTEDSQSSNGAPPDTYDAESEPQPVSDDSVDRAASSDSYGAEMDTLHEDGNASDSAPAQNLTAQSDFGGAADDNTGAEDASHVQTEGYQSSQNNYDRSMNDVHSDAAVAEPAAAVLNDSYGDPISMPGPSSSYTSDFYGDSDSVLPSQALAAGSDAQESFHSYIYNSPDGVVREVSGEPSDSYSATSIPDSRDSASEANSTDDNTLSNAGTSASPYSQSAGTEPAYDADSGGSNGDAGGSGADIVGQSSGGADGGSSD